MKRLLEIPWDKRAIFLRRPNRFLGICRDMESGRELKVHVRDPGRLKELLFEGNEVLIRRAEAEGRKTDWDLIAARSALDGWVLVNSGLHSRIASLILSDDEISPFGRAISIKPEIKVGRSRLDFLVELEKGEKVFIEVKGCTLQKGGKALFPDAPTERGRRHLLELLDIVKQGHRAAVFFLILCPGVKCFDANIETDPLFYDTLYKVLGQGVGVFPLYLEYRKGFIWYKRRIEMCRN